MIERLCSKIIYHGHNSQEEQKIPLINSNFISQIMDEAIRVLLLPVGHSRNPVLVSDPGGPLLGHSRNPSLVSDPGGPLLGHSRNPVLVSDPLGPLAPFLLTSASFCQPPDVGEDVDVIQPQGIQASPALPGPIKYTLRKETI
jgi:hypothetical protein